MSGKVPWELHVAVALISVEVMVILGFALYNLWSYFK